MSALGTPSERQYRFHETATDIKGQRITDSRARNRISLEETRWSLEYKIQRMSFRAHGQPTSAPDPFETAFSSSVFPWVGGGTIRLEFEDKQLREVRSAIEFRVNYRQGLIYPNAVNRQVLVDALLVRIEQLHAAMPVELRKHIDPKRAIGSEIPIGATA